MDLFDYMRETNMKKGESPLAKRLRPTSLDEVVGQEHILGKDQLDYLIWSTRDGEDNACDGDCQYDERGI